MHPVVFRELEGLKNNVDSTTRYKAQKGFVIIEKYRNYNRLFLVRENTRDIKYSTADEQIISDLLTKVEEGSKLVFASHDKGARILARRLDISIINPKKM
ncbi:PIN domain-containing protein [Sporosarcina sp. OR05]|uniref:PIN domain-containing protein n=1 Tax=Sporosarcina sp. OR05 TaxID=2969819 RepID=UPI00352B1890